MSVQNIRVDHVSLSVLPLPTVVRGLEHCQHHKGVGIILQFHYFHVLCTIVQT